MAEGDSELKDASEICILMPNSLCVTPAAVIVKKILHDPTNDNFSVFLFFIVIIIIIIIIISGAPRAREARTDRSTMGKKIW